MPVLNKLDRSAILSILLTTAGGLATYYYYYYHVKRSILAVTQQLKNIPVPKGRVPYFGTRNV